jgi:hypothetical protein
MGTLRGERSAKVTERGGGALMELGKALLRALTAAAIGWLLIMLLLQNVTGRVVG